ncbi:MAG: Fur family transcriptional regulator [Candidatus Aminicenantales bacterium]
MTKSEDWNKLKIVSILKLKSLKNRLNSHGIRPTYIRLKILDYLEKHRSHPTAEEIHDALVREIPTMSLTSVYNTLNVFYEKGLINQLFITGSEARYDREISPHHHFFCEKCGRIIDLDIECSFFKKGSVKGHQITELHGYFKGVCKDCFKKGKLRHGSPSD